MEKRILTCFFIMCFFYLSFPKDIFGQQSPTLAEEVFEEYKETFKNPDIQKFFPPVLRAFKNENYQNILNSDIINRFVIVPNSLRSVYQDGDNSIIELLTTDTKFRELFQNPDFHNVLQDTTAIDQLAELIENIQIPTEIVKFSENSQSGTPGSLLKPFIVVVKDQNDIPIEGISVTFSLISGDGKLSDSTPTTDSNGQASTTFTLGQTPVSLIEASVEGVKPVIFIATAVVSEEPTFYLTISPEKDFFVVGEELTVELKIANAENINPKSTKKEDDYFYYKATLQYDPDALMPDALEYIDGKQFTSYTLDYTVVEEEPKIIFCFPGNSDDSGGENTSTKSATITINNIINKNKIYINDIPNERILAKLTFRVRAPHKTTILTLSDVSLRNHSNGKREFYVRPNKTVQTLGSADVNGDGEINILDIVLVASEFGKNLEDLSVPAADVNGDSVVNILDLVLVGGSIEHTTSAPSIYDMEKFNVSAKDVRTWLTQAKAINSDIPETTKAHPAYQRGIAVLENLLSTLTQEAAAPQKTALLLNYPNPFNPETWIPYQLAEATDVTVTIHSMNGSLIRTLSLGHQSAGLYRSKSRAAYWDGKNEFGEQVASGLYFYTLTAGKFSATGKMLIRK